MEELISRIISNVGLDEETAKSTVGIVLDFLRSEGPEDKIAQLMSALPGAQDLADQAASAGGGGLLGGMMGGMMGGAMGAFTKLQSAGLDMDQVQGLTKEVVGFAKEKAGDETVDELLASIPGLNQFI